MIPYLRLAIFAGVALLCFGTGYKFNDYRRDSQDLKLLQAAELASSRATTAAVDAIGKIRIQRTTIRQELEREIHFAPASPDCDISDGMLNTLNKALAPPGDNSAGVSGSNPAD